VSVHAMIPRFLISDATSMAGLPGRVVALASFFFGVVALAKFVDSWLIPAEKQKFKERAIQVWYLFGTGDPVAVIQTPLRFLSKLFTVVYGQHIFSWQAFYRSTIASLLLLIAALGVTGRSVAIPAHNLDNTFALIDQVIASDAVKKEWSKKENEQGSKVIIGWINKAKTYHTYTNNILYNVLFYFVFVVLNSLMGFASVVIARLTLRDMTQAKTLTTLGSLALANSLVFLGVYCIFLTIVCAAATPLTWIIVWLLFLIFVYWSWSIALSLLIPATIVALFFSPDWIRVAAANAALPGLLVLLLSVLAVILFPFKTSIHRIVLELIDRATVHEKGVFGFLIIFFSGLAVFISALARWFP